MLFICHNSFGTSYHCSNSPSKQVYFDQSEFLYDANANLLEEYKKYEYVVGNNLYNMINNGIIGHSLLNQKFIDVCMYGLTNELINEMGINAIMYVYNNWIDHESEIMPYNKLRCDYWVSELPEHYKEQIYYVYGSYKYRFNCIIRDIERLKNNPDFIGMTWPTCHYLSDLNPQVRIFYKSANS